MSYSPSSPRSRIALGALTTTATPSTLHRDSPGSVDVDALRCVLLALTCPASCGGIVGAPGRHRACEARADAAIEALGVSSSFLTAQTGAQRDTGAARAVVVPAAADASAHRGVPDWARPRIVPPRSRSRQASEAAAA